MGGVRILPEPGAAIGRLLNATRQTGLERLQAVLACTFTFDRGYFEQLLDALSKCHSDGWDLLRGIPIDVVCDHRHYRGHGSAYNAHCWPESNLFHPKLVLLLFSDKVIWIEGSLNMTRAGYVVNRELASYHEDRRRKLPHGVHLLSSVLAAQGVGAAKEIVRSTTQERVDTKNRSLTSIDAPILDGRLPSTGRARSVYIVTPFFDRREKSGTTIDATVLGTLARAYPDAQFRIFAPEITRRDGKRALQASKALFEQVFGPQVSQRRVAICAVPSDNYPLHAKLIAVRSGAHGGQASVLTGSPNVTEVALLRKGKGANVELARLFSARWKHVEGLLHRLGRKFRPISAYLFEPPRSISPSGWHALKSAVYDPFKRQLGLEWISRDHPGKTRLYYAGRRVVIPRDGPIREFVALAGELRIETVCRDDPKRRSWCPIIVPLTARLALANLPTDSDPPPEWWLFQLGALPVAVAEKDSGEGRGAAGRAPSDSTAFSMAQRIRDLTDRMAYALDVLTGDPTQSNARVGAHLSLLERIFDAHDPARAMDAAEQAWRLWVRLEIAQVLDLAVSRSKLIEARGGRLQRRLTRAMRNESLPPDVTRQWKELTASIG